MKKVTKIVLYGAESTGKSTLAEQLATHYKTVWNPEYVRSYVDICLKNGLIASADEISYQHVEAIAIGQIISEDNAIQHAKNGIVILDTNLLMTKIYSLHIYQQYPTWIDKELKQREYDLYLFTQKDLGWQQDAQRSDAETQSYFDTIFAKEAEKLQKNIVKVEGNGNIRFENAIRAIATWKKKPKK